MIYPSALKKPELGAELFKRPHHTTGRSMGFTIGLVQRKRGAAWMI